MLHTVYMGRKSGFTLLEITIVIGIISLLLTLGSNLFVFSKQSARDTVRKTDINQIRAALEFYREEDPNRYYPDSLAGLLESNGGYIASIPKDPISSSFEYFYERGAVDPANYVVGTRLERGGPSACGSCGSQQCNYCFSALGLLITPTPSVPLPSSIPTNTPIPPTSALIQTPTPSIPTPTPTSTPTPTTLPLITCYQIGTTRVGETATLYSGQGASLWTINNTLDCTPSVGTGSIFTTVCQQSGSTTVYITNGSSSNSCPLTISP